MSTFLSIFCRSEKRLAVECVIEFLSDGVFFDSDPKFVCTPSGSPAAEFESIEVHYDPKKRPVVISHDVPRSSYDTEDAIEEINESGSTASSEKLIHRIRETRQIIVIEIDSVGATEEAWEMCDCFEAYVADVLDGIIYVPGEGIYDKKLKKLKRLSSDER